MWNTNKPWYDNQLCINIKCLVIKTQNIAIFGGVMAFSKEGLALTNFVIKKNFTLSGSFVSGEYLLVIVFKWLSTCNNKTQCSHSIIVCLLVRQDYNTWSIGIVPSIDDQRISCHFYFLKVFIVFIVLRNSSWQLWSLWKIELPCRHSPFLIVVWYKQLRNCLTIITV